MEKDYFEVNSSAFPVQARQRCNLIISQRDETFFPICNNKVSKEVILTNDKTLANQHSSILQAKYIKSNAKLFILVPFEIRAKHFATKLFVYDFDCIETAFSSTVL